MTVMRFKGIPFKLRCRPFLLPQKNQHKFSKLEEDPVYERNVNNYSILEDERKRLEQMKEVTEKKNICESENGSDVSPRNEDLDSLCETTTEIVIYSSTREKDNKKVKSHAVRIKASEEKIESVELDAHHALNVSSDLKVEEESEDDANIIPYEDSACTNENNSLASQKTEVVYYKAENSEQCLSSNTEENEREIEVRINSFRRVVNNTTTTTTSATTSAREEDVQENSINEMKKTKEKRREMAKRKKLLVETTQPTEDKPFTQRSNAASVACSEIVVPPSPIVSELTKWLKEEAFCSQKELKTKEVTTYNYTEKNFSSVPLKHSLSWNPESTFQNERGNNNEENKFLEGREGTRMKLSPSPRSEAGHNYTSSGGRNRALQATQAAWLDAQNRVFKKTCTSSVTESSQQPFEEHSNVKIVTRSESYFSADGKQECGRKYEYKVTSWKKQHGKGENERNRIISPRCSTNSVPLDSSTKKPSSSSNTRTLDSSSSSNGSSSSSVVRKQKEVFEQQKLRDKESSNLSQLRTTWERVGEGSGHYKKIIISPDGNRIPNVLPPRKSLNELP